MSVETIIGKPESGKTTYAKYKAAEMYVKSKAKNKEIIVLTFKTQNYANMKSIIMEVAMDEGVDIDPATIKVTVFRFLDAFLLYCLKRANSIAIMDEWESFVPDDDRGADYKIKDYKGFPMKEFFSGAREYNNHIMPILHGWQDFYKWILKYMHPGGITRFNTLERLDVQINRFKNDFPQIAEDLEAHPEIKPFRYRFILISAA